MATESAQQIIETIVKNTRLSETEVQSLVESKKEKFSGMLTDSGAAFMIAKELNVPLAMEKSFTSITPISQLKSGMNQVDIQAKVLQVFPPKEFEKNGRSGMLQNLVLGDESGSIRLTIWDQDVQAMQDQHIEKGAALLLKNCAVSAYKEQLQLQLNYNGSVSIESNQAQPATPLNALKDGMKNVDVFARVQSLFPTQEFERNGQKGLRSRMLLSDGNKTIPAIAWNESVEQVERIPLNSIVKIENAYAKNGLNGEIELHLGFNARVMVNPQNAPSLGNAPVPTAPEKKIESIQPEEYCELNGTILQLNRLSTFPTCPQCGSKVDTSAETDYCPKCDRELESVPKMVLNIQLDDGSGTINVVLFGETAEQAIGLTAVEWENKSLEKDPLKEMQDRVQGKKWKVQGKARENKISGELEFSARNMSLQ